MNNFDNKPNIKFDGYRKNVGIILCNNKQQVLWARRKNYNSWQFPQGGIEPNESPQQAVFRELYEEIGLLSSDVRLLGTTLKWLYYDVPHTTNTWYHGKKNCYRGQKQRWFLFQLISGETQICLYKSNQPEFDSWCWTDYWHPAREVVSFKRAVYRQALTELKPMFQTAKHI